MKKHEHQAVKGKSEPYCTMNINFTNHASYRPLHGVPILLKDNIVTLDSMEATAGSYALKGAKPGHEATIATNYATLAPSSWGRRA